MKIRYGIQLVWCLSLSVLHIAAMNRLQKAELHTGTPEGETQVLQQLEVAKLVCYFKDKPLVQHLQTVRKQNGWEYQTYLLMHAECDAAAQKSFDQIKNVQHKHFYITTEMVQKPMLALKLEIGYDPQQVDVNYDTFDAITRQSGVLFRLINRPPLQRLATQERPLLQLAHHRMGKSAIVGIDCGHGGRDAGATSNNVVEKEVTLQVGLLLAQMLNDKGLQTFMTRADDRAVSLPERTNMLNTKGADIMISIHANSASSVTYSGIETFYMHHTLLRPHMQLTYEQQLRSVLAQRHQQSAELARQVHTHVVQGVCDDKYTPRDRHVKPGASQLLLGATMPAILIEVGFLTHAQEAAQLADTTFQLKLARGMCDGIMAYLQA